MRFFLALLFIPIVSSPDVSISDSAAPTKHLPDQAVEAQASSGSYANESYVFDFIEKNIRFEADGKGQKDTTFRVRIQSESAVREYGLLVYPFASGFETLDVDYVRVRKPDGTVVETPSSDFQEIDTAVSRIAPMYSDEREKHIAVKSLAVGDVLEAHLRWVIHDAMAPGYFWYDQNFFQDGICLRERLTIDLPKNVDAKLRSPGLRPELREEGARRIYSFERSVLKRRPESKIPEWERNARGASPPDVQVTSFSSWAELGKWFGGLELTKVAVTPEIQAKADELTKAKTGEEEKIRALYDFVSTHFRYIGVELGHGRFTPHSASEIMQNRYGDCKDKQVLLTALLAAAGIQSYPALVSSRFAVDPSFPTISLFDHVITAIGRNSSVQFVDSTPEVAPVGFLSFPIRDRKALVIPPNVAATLVDTPADPPFHAYELFRVESSITSDGTLDGKILMEDRGDSELLFRSAYHSTPQNQWEQLTQRLVSALGFGGNVSDVEVDRTEDSRRPFTLQFNYRRTEYPYWKDRRISFPVPPFFLRTLNEEQKQAANPLPLGPLQDLSYEATVKFPDGYLPVFPGIPVERKTDFAEFSATYDVQKGTLKGKFHLKTLVREIPAGERISYTAFADAVRQEMSRYIFVSQNRSPEAQAASAIASKSPEPSSAAKPVYEAANRADKDGNFAVSVQLYEQVTALDPNFSDAWNRLAFAYGKVGKTQKEEAALRKALALDPASRWAHYNLGNVLMAQKKYDEAISEYLKEIESKSNNSLVHLNLGRVYVLSGQPDKGIPELKVAAGLMPTNPAVQFNLGLAYARTGQPEAAAEAFIRSVELEPTIERKNSVAYEMATNKLKLDQAARYAESAIKTLAAKTRDLSLDNLSNDDVRAPAALGAYWDTMGWVKFQQGDMAAAERYTRSAWQLRSIGEIGDHLGQIYERLERKQDAATMYELSIATGFPMPDTEAKLTALVGKGADIKQLVQDARSRSVKAQTVALKNEHGLNGEAEFWLLLERGPKVGATKFIGGDESLRGIADELKDVALDFSLPDSDEVKLPRRAKVICAHDSGTCTLVLASSETVRSVN